MRTYLARALITVAAVAVATGSAAADITGAGSTFVYPILAKWSADYNVKTGTKVNYQSIGSGGGIKQIQNKTVNFGATDMPLTPTELDKDGLMQFPTIIGGDIPVVNLEGIKPGELKLTGPLLADIYLGKVTKWNDPAIAKLNPGVKLPDLDITVVHRSDGSGTTFIWVNYLSKVSPEWKSKIGEGTSVAWPAGVGGKGNEGVASYVQRVKGAIGYVEYAYSLQNKMTYTQVQNREGVFVQPSAQTFKAAAASADWSKAPGYYLVLTDQVGKDAWPITGSTFILMYRAQAKPEEAKEVLKFFDWAFSPDGDKLADSLDYVPLPVNVTTQIRQSWKNEIKDSGGKSVY